MKAEKKRGKQVASTDFTVTGITMNVSRFRIGMFRTM